jgi:hypothetical protein
MGPTDNRTEQTEQTKKDKNVRSDSTKQQANRKKLNVDDNHKSKDMNKHRRGTYP